MNYQNFERWTELTKKVQEPIQAITELNIRTLQSLSYLKPEELTHIKRPEEVLEKQINLVVENSHKALDYMQQSFLIMEKALLGLGKETIKAAEKAADDRKN